MIKKILIANRGEIACRIIRTAKKMGIGTVAVYSRADQNSRHVQMADESVCIGPPNPLESYLNQEVILSCAQHAQAQAIHPGYGFLSENADFAQLCQDNGLIFIGPSAQAISAMGSKHHAKQLMAKANVPVIPGYHGHNQSVDHLLNEAQKMGFPILVKASFGGGGKGMHIVNTLEECEEAIRRAQRESKASFGHDHLILERYFPVSQHIEVQVFGDTHGNRVHLFERDCSIQRRHQKIIEQAPSQLPKALLEKLYQSALQAAHAIDYTGAGTIEFLVADQNHYFLEMNTRLQVEHPVTERITGIDLVEWQIKVAQGEPLPLKQAAILQKGVAIEARVYAEDPQQEFLPMTGTIHKILSPKENKHIRLESGIQAQDEIGIYYDPMLAKVVAFGLTRQHAVHWLQEILKQYEIIGIKTNLDFLRRLARLKAFSEQEIDSRFLEIHRSSLLPSEQEAPPLFLVQAALVYVLNLRKHPKGNTPWHSINAFKLNQPNDLTLTLSHRDTQYPLNITILEDMPLRIAVHCASLGVDTKISGTLNDDILHYELEHHRSSLFAYCTPLSLHLFKTGEDAIYEIPQPCMDDPQSTDPKHHLLAPMPGKITQIWVQNGESVNKGDKLLVMEAMKMEHTLWAHQSAVVKTIHYKIGDLVDQGSELFEFDYDG